MCVVFNKEKFYYQRYKFSESTNVLRVLLGEKEYSGTHLFIPREWCNKLVKKVVNKYKDKFEYIVFDDNLFISSNFPQYSKDNYSKLATGETWKTVLNTLFSSEPMYKREILAVQDDGSRSFIAPIYYGLRENNMLRKRRASLKKILNAPIYVDNYYSTSNSIFTRAKHKFSYFDYFGEWDYVFAPLCATRLKEQLVKMSNESRIGYLIYGGKKALEDVPFTKKIIIGRSCYLYKELTSEKQGEVKELKSSKASKKQLTSILQKDIK